MLRLRTLIIILPLIVLIQAAPVASASPDSAAPAWKPGNYLGMISIDAYEKVALQPLPPGTLHEEHTIEILFSSGSMQAHVNNNGQMTTSFSIPIKFRYMDWAQEEDWGSGLCEGQRSEGTGHGHLWMRPSLLMPQAGAKFSGGNLPFKFEGFSGSIRKFGKNCPEVDGERMRSEMEHGFKELFKGGINFEVKMAKGSIVAGYCYMPGFQLEGDHAFDCTWYVQRVK